MSDDISIVLELTLDEAQLVRDVVGDVVSETARDIFYALTEIPELARKTQVAVPSRSKQLTARELVSYKMVPFERL
jgi:hypothetical protein